MIYDNTDISGWTKQLKEYTPDPIDDLIDEMDLQLGLTHSWMAGGWLYRQFGRFDHVAGFSSWADALQWLCEIEPEKQIDEIQYWGHGSPGKVWMNGQVLTKHAFDTTVYGELLMRLKTRLTDESLVWLRCCSVFHGAKGHEFAKVWTEKLGCNVAAHTFIIHLFQSGLYALRPGEEPYWPLEEGLNEGTAEEPLSLRWGMLWSPHTILALQSRLPRWAYQDWT